jgi:HEAT repeat protein
LREKNAQPAAAVSNLTHLIQHGEVRDRLRALESIAAYGAEAKSAVPALIDVLVGPPPQLPGMTAGTRPPPQIPSVFANSAAASARRDAAIAIGEIGPGANAAVPALTWLIRAGRDPYLAAYCKALGKIGPAATNAVPLLEFALTNENHGIRLAAADALSRIVPQHCTKAVVVLRQLQHDAALAVVWVADATGFARKSPQLDFENPASRFFRMAATVSLWRLGLEKEPPTQAIIQELGNPGGDEIAYVELLGEIGPQASRAIPLLTRILNSERFILLRRAAGIAIRKIDPGEAEKLGFPGVFALP